jgi:hypothetical protein
VDDHERLGKLVAAEALLREAGRDDIADLAAEEVAKWDDFQREVVRLVRDMLGVGALLRP